MEKLLRDIGAPKIYYKKLLEAKYPKTIQTSFIANLAKKEPVNSSNTLFMMMRVILLILGLNNKIWGQVSGELKKAFWNHLGGFNFP